MRDQVVMSKANAQLAIAVPLFRWHHEEKLANLQGYSLDLTNSAPLAYVIDCGGLGCQVFNAAFIEANMEFLGDLE